MKDRQPLPSDLPGNLGIPPEAISRFIARLQETGLCMHSILILRRGAVAAEAYWNPYNADSLNRLYSCSKSFVSAAIGCLASEGRLALTDPVVKFFPDKVPADLHPYVAQTTIRDLLLMATPHLFAKVTYSPRDPDWADTFFRTPPTHLPGKIFSYDTTATVMLAIIAERLAGGPFLEYLRPRLLDPMGCSRDMTCIQSPCGYSWGGSGVLATTRDFAKFALVCMNGGRHGGRQLLPEAYIREATSRQIDNSVAEYDIEHRQGYGYQFWRTTHNGFACFGMGSQYAICLPDKDFILVTTGDTQGCTTAGAHIFGALWGELYPSLADGPLPSDPAAQERLQAQIGGLALPLPVGATRSPMAERVSGRRYVMTPGELPISSVEFSFEGDLGSMAYETPSGNHVLSFGFGRQHSLKFPESSYSGMRIGVPKTEGYDCLSAAAWVDEHSLAITTWIVDSHIGNLKINVVFGEPEGTVTIMMVKAAEWFLDGYTGFVSGRARGG